MIAVITSVWAIVALVVVVGGLGIALAIAGDDHERPVPQPPAAPPSPAAVDRDLTDDEVRRMVAAWQRDRDRKRAVVLAEMEAEHEVLRGRREREAEALIDRVFPDPDIPKGER